MTYLHGGWLGWRHSLKWRNFADEVSAASYPALHGNNFTTSGSSFPCSTMNFGVISEFHLNVHREKLGSDARKVSPFSLIPTCHFQGIDSQSQRPQSQNNPGLPNYCGERRPTNSDRQTIRRRCSTTKLILTCWKCTRGQTESSFF